MRILLLFLISVKISWSVHTCNALIVPSTPLTTVGPTMTNGNNGPSLFAPFAARQISDDTVDLKPCEENEHRPKSSMNHRRARFRKQLVSKIKISLAFLSPVAMASSTIALVASPQKAHAGAPVMAMPKMKTRDPAQEAFDRHEKQLMTEAQTELSDFQSKAREIEQQEGPAARTRFENEYKESQEAKVGAFKEGLRELKRNLLDQGIDPFQDIEGKRQVIFYEKGVDLGEVDGTKFNMEKRYATQGSERSYAFIKKSNREVIKAMVQDLKNRGMDPLEYFERNPAKIDMVLNLPADKAAVLATKYNENLELYGQIMPPKDGEKSIKEMISERGDTSNQKQKANNKADQKRLKAEAKAKVASDKAETKAKAKEEKEQIKKEKQAAKEDLKKEKDLAEASAIAATASSMHATAALSPPTDIGDSLDSLPQSVNDENSPIDGSDGVITNDHAVAMTDGAPSVAGKKRSGGIKIIPAAVVIASVGGGAFALKMVRDRSDAEEDERRRQFKLLMGEVEGQPSESTDDSAGLDGNTLSDLMFEYENLTEEDNEDNDVNPPETIELSTPKPKKRRGLKSVFGKKKNGREVDIASLVAPSAKASEFSKILAKVLTFGAPGRFPEVTKLPGDMPMETFDIEKATNVLKEAQDSTGITKEESAEIFANVVNCMLIDIVDLASTSLKEEDQKVTTDAISIVITFMDLAAQLYTSIADGIDIVPVTYGGEISKKKLEQMFSTYAISGMMNMSDIDEKFDDRVSLLQDVFQISSKKAEGLMSKAMQKNMMEMMKSGEMPEGMEDMMKGMEGMGGLPGMDGDEEPDPEQVKEMLKALKDLKDSGSLPESELNEVKKQFEEAFGSKIDELMKNASESGEEIGEADKELLDLMKAILD